MLIYILSRSILYIGEDAMEPLLDLDRLHKKRNISLVRNYSIGIIVAILLVFVSLAFLSSNKKTINHVATVSGTVSATPANVSATNTSTSQQNALSTTDTSSISSICTPANEASNHEIATDCTNYYQAMKGVQSNTSNAAALQQEQQKLQQYANNLISTNNQASSTPTSTYTPTPTPTYTPTPTPTYTAPSCPQLASLTQQLTQAENQLASVEASSQSTSGTQGGLTGGSQAALYAGLIAQAQQGVNSSQQQLNNYRQQNPGC